MSCIFPAVSLGEMRHLHPTAQKNHEEKKKKSAKLLMIAAT